MAARVFGCAWPLFDLTTDTARVASMRRRCAVLWLVLLPLIAACRHPSASESAELTRERAIEIARSQVSFTPDSIEAIKANSSGKPVWRVTFRGRLPGQPPGLFETMIVEVHRESGEIVSVART